MNLADIRAATARLDGTIGVHARDGATGETWPIAAFTLSTDGTNLVADVPAALLDSAVKRVLNAVVATVNQPG